MARKILRLKVVKVDLNTLKATLIDPEEIDDVVNYEVFIPAHFGGQTNPYPKVGELLNLRYETGFHFRQQPIQEVWREREMSLA